MELKLTLFIIIFIIIGGFVYYVSKESERKKLLFLYEKHLNKHEDDKVSEIGCIYCEKEKEFQELSETN